MNLGIDECATRSIHSGANENERANVNQSHQEQVHSTDIFLDFAVLLLYIKPHKAGHHHLNGNHDQCGNHHDGRIEQVQRAKQETDADACANHHGTPDETRHEVFVEESDGRFTHLGQNADYQREGDGDGNRNADADDKSLP